MSEAELANALAQSITLTFSATTWWFSATSALVLASFLGARHIPLWLFLVVMALYAIVIVLTFYQLAAYWQTAAYYFGRLKSWRAEHGVAQQPDPVLSQPLAAGLSVAVLVLGCVGAIAFSVLTWRAARRS